MPEEISAAEKRKLLREKRANRLANGSSRLNKILGTDEHPDIVVSKQTSIESADLPSTEPSFTSGAKAHGVNASQRKGNRISMLLDSVEDPPTSSLDDYEVSLESNESPFDEFVSNDRTEMNIEEMLNKMLQTSAKDGHGHGEGFCNPDFDDISNKGMASMFSSIRQMPGMGPAPIKTQAQISRSKLLQSTYSVLRIATVFSLVQMNFPETWLSAYAVYPHNFSLWVQFLYTEIFFGLIQLLFNYLSIFPNNTILSFDISQFGYANSIFNAYSIMRNFYNDFCCLIIAIGLSVYLI